jgi:hypothetical protein
MRDGQNSVSAMHRIGFDSQTCLDCGAPMRETLRWQQGEMLFSWFECTREECPSKFLRKANLAASPAFRPLRMVTKAAMHA